MIFFGALANVSMRSLQNHLWDVFQLNLEKRSVNDDLSFSQENTIFCQLHNSRLSLGCTLINSLFLPRLTLLFHPPRTGLQDCIFAKKQRLSRNILIPQFLYIHNLLCYYEPFGSSLLFRKCTKDIYAQLIRGNTSIQFDLIFHKII